ncbi:hypothetical protein J7K07_04185 [Candidatus Bathyarchaeota archaeon]|nr:hypothetical protein [Candidatus Bathyarchaeota archaeon]
MEREFQGIICERKLLNSSKIRERTFVYGYGITIGLDRKPQIRESGNVKPEAKPGISILLCRRGFLLHVLLSLE